MAKFISSEKSEKRSLNLRDIVKGAVVSVIPMVLPAILLWSQMQPVDWMSTLRQSAYILVTYLVATFFEDTNGMLK